MSNRAQFKRLHIQLTTLEPMRIGGPDDPLSERHNPVALVGGKPVIPGASLKGAIRHACERYLITMFWNNGNWKSGAETAKPCIPGPSLSNDEKSLVEQNKYRDSNCHYPCDVRDSRGKCKEKHSICPACYLFGAQGLVGFVRVPFLFTDVSYGELYAARLDRMKGTVREGTNRPYELVPKGAVFQGEMSILTHDPVKGWTLGQSRPLKELSEGDAWLRPGVWENKPDLVDLLKNLLTSIDIIGGYRSRGCGGVKIEVKDIKS
ncbi:MAG: RAMP superfamily CRISPR-associated protein [Candidatus Caldarchaeum sp.]